MSIEIRATLLALAASLGLLGATLGLSPFLQPSKAADSRREPSTKTISPAADGALEGEARQGRSLFERNCAHCHGDDARGDEGPTLYELRKSDARISTIIKRGIKGEMPTFGTKLNDADIRALIAYLRTLKS
jgi:mono/diheme cytochrome c family protein